MVDLQGGFMEFDCLGGNMTQPDNGGQIVHHCQHCQPPKKDIVWSNFPCLYHIYISLSYILRICMDYRELSTGFGSYPQV